MNLVNFFLLHENWLGACLPLLLQLGLLVHVTVCVLLGRQNWATKSKWKDKKTKVIQIMMWSWSDRKVLATSNRLFNLAVYFYFRCLEWEGVFALILVLLVNWASTSRFSSPPSSKGHTSGTVKITTFPLWVESQIEFPFQFLEGTTSNWFEAT